MLPRTTLMLTAAVLLGTARLATAQPAFPVVDDVQWEPFRDHCGRLIRSLEVLKAPLPADTLRSLETLLREGARDPDAPLKVQKLLDAHCLIAVNINPESRVKAVRGPAPADLVEGHETVLLLKVHNEAGVTNALALSGTQLRSNDQPAGWLEAVLHTDPPLQKELSGRPLEYLLVRLTAREAGKREATLKFDVGQGTQDLGFRGEVPVLFTIRPMNR